MVSLRDVLPAAAVLTALSAGTATAGSVTYPHIGTENPVQYTFTASSTGEIDAYFAGSGAAYDEVIGMDVNGVSTGIYGLDDHTSKIGQMLDLGNVVAGDVITFIDYVYPGGIGSNIVPNGATYEWSSDASANVDGGNHVYATSVTTGQAYKGSPAGMYVAFEDLKFPHSDFNYHDDTFVFRNVASAQVAEPSTWALLMAGFAGVGYAAFVRGRKTPACGNRRLERSPI